MSCKYICGEYEVTFRLSRLIGARVKIARLDSSIRTNFLRSATVSTISLERKRQGEMLRRIH